MSEAEEAEIILDNDVAFKNLQEYLTDLKINYEIKSTHPEMVIRFAKPGEVAGSKRPEDFCGVPSTSNDYVVVIKSSEMGSGDPELGALLMRAFLNSLLENTVLPSAILLYNSGVRLAIENADTLDSLRQLEEKGIMIMSCGTCLDFYQLKERLSVGIITNMYKILQLQTNASKVIYP